MRLLIFGLVFGGLWSQLQSQILHDTARAKLVELQPDDHLQPTNHRVELKKSGTFEVYNVQYSKQLVETSGLVYQMDGPFKGMWSQNDGGNAPCLFRMSAKLEMTTDSVSPLISFCFNSIRNYDWEAIACDGSTFYIGDIGNNFGTRKNLKIYTLKQLYSTKDGIKEYQPILDSIEFSYPDQTNFKFRRFHPYDAESMVVYGDSIYILTKNWNNCKSNVYAFNKHESKPTVFKQKTLKLGFLATDACLLGNRLFVVGYNFFGKQFIAEFDWKTKKRLAKRKINLKDGQIEGICYNFNLQDFVLSTESRKQEPAKVFRIR